MNLKYQTDCDCSWEILSGNVFYCLMIFPQIVISRVIKGIAHRRPTLVIYYKASNKSDGLIKVLLFCGKNSALNLNSVICKHLNESGRGIGRDTIFAKISYMSRKVNIYSAEGGQIKWPLSVWDIRSNHRPPFETCKIMNTSVCSSRPLRCIMSVFSM